MTVGGVCNDVLVDSHGLAKGTWQHTVKNLTKRHGQDSGDPPWSGHNGVHLDPRTVYQRCQELEYGQFGSAQGLLDAM